MTLDELIDALTEIRDDLGTGDVPVRIAQQPKWALEYEIGQVVMSDASEDKRIEIKRTLASDTLDDEKRRAAQQALDDLEDQTAVYIGEGSQLGYLPGAAAAELGWSSR